MKLSKLSIGIPSLLSTKLQRRIIELTVEPTGVMPELPEKLTVEPEEVTTTVGKVENPLPQFKLV